MKSIYCMAEQQSRLFSIHSANNNCFTKEQENLVFIYLNLGVDKFIEIENASS